jgi:hypothetical protein
MSFNFGGVDSATGEAVEGEVGVVSDDAAGEAVVAPGRAPIRAGDGVCALESHNAAQANEGNRNRSHRHD